MFQALLCRQLPAVPVESGLKPGVGGQLTGHALLMAPFGAACVLLFSVPSSPLSQPQDYSQQENDYVKTY